MVLQNISNLRNRLNWPLCSYQDVDESVLLAGPLPNTSAKEDELKEAMRKEKEEMEKERETTAKAMADLRRMVAALLQREQNEKSPSRKDARKEEAGNGGGGIEVDGGLLGDGFGRESCAYPDPVGMNTGTSRN